MQIREATLDDLQNLVEIWKERSAEAIGRPATEDEKILLCETVERCIIQRHPSFRVWVADVDGVIVGWQSLMPCTSNPFSRYSRAESSTYTLRRTRVADLGFRLVKHAVDFAEQSPLVAIIAILRCDNIAIQRVGQRLGFVKVGDFPLIPKWSKDLMSIYVRSVELSVNHTVGV